MSAEAHKRGAPAYRYVQLPPRPPERGHRPARERARQARALPRRPDRHQAPLQRCSTSACGDEADLASYLLFDGTFCRQLIEMGRADAEARRDELLAFFGDPADDGGVDEGDDSGKWDRRSATIPLGT